MVKVANGVDRWDLSRMTDSRKDTRIDKSVKVDVSWA